jgi:hypothetical protein
MRHPLRNLLILTAFGFYVKHRADQHGGFRNLWSDLQHPFRRARAARR